MSILIKNYGELKDIPEGLHAVVKAEENLEPGVIFVLKNINSSVNINKLNRLHPFYLVYMKSSGDIVLNHVEPKKILDAMRKASKGIKNPIVDLCNDLSIETDDYEQMDPYSQLLKQSISTILQREEEKDVMSLFQSGGTTALQDKLKGIEDFKLISFLIIK